MSAYQVDPAHINYLVNVCLLYDVHPAKPYTPEQLGALFAGANAASVNHRYAHHNRPCAPIAYTFTITPRAKITPIQAIVAAQCLDYQSCQYDGWETSEAKQILDRLIQDAITRLPGYDAASWEITES